MLAVRLVEGAIDFWVVDVPGFVEWPLDALWAAALLGWLAAEYRFRRARARASSSRR